MTKHIRLAFSFIASLCLCATSVSAQADAAAIATGLRGTITEQSRALRELRGVEPENIDQGIRQALIEATMRNNRAGAARMQRIRSGTAGPADDREDNHFVLVRALASLRDPETIPALVGALGAGLGGLSLYQPLAEFGEPAARLILDGVMHPASSQDLVEGGLISLRLMVELSPGLSATTIEELTLAAERYLTAPSAGSASVLIRAIDLAAVLSDPRLDELLGTLVSERAEVEARVEEGSYNRIEQIQERAQRALARVPPLPRPR